MHTLYPLTRISGTAMLTIAALVTKSTKNKRAHHA